MSLQNVPRLFVIAALALVVVPLAPMARAEAVDDAKALFERFVAAQNTHDLKAVGALLSDSHEMLWITRGLPIWGREASLQRFEALYKGTWHLDPAMADFKAFALGRGVIQLFVPVTFMIAPPGQAAQPQKFLMNQTLVKTAKGWKIASILPILVPPP
jgi:ketosteroid isomerase-like protein